MRRFYLGVVEHICVFFHYIVSLVGLPTTLFDFSTVACHAKL